MTPDIIPGAMAGQVCRRVPHLSDIHADRGGGEKKPLEGHGGDNRPLSARAGTIGVHPAAQQEVHAVPGEEDRRESQARPVTAMPKSPDQPMCRAWSSSR